MQNLLLRFVLLFLSESNEKEDVKGSAQDCRNISFVVLEDSKET